MSGAETKRLRSTYSPCLAGLMVILFAALAIGPGPARAGTLAGADPCPTQSYYGWFGDSRAVETTVPDPEQPGVEYASVVVKPTDAARFPGRRPVVVYQHGLNGDICSGMWIARYLAGEGFVVETHTSPPDPDRIQAFDNGVEATYAAVSFMRSAQNPYAAVTDGDRLGLGGHSMGSSVVSLVQGDPALDVKAIVVSDSLKRWLNPEGDCGEVPAAETVPRAPALGFAKDEHCVAAPGGDLSALKLSGFDHWRAAGLPVMSLAMRGFVHGDFTLNGGNQKNRLLANYWGAWMGRWLLPDTDQDANLLRRNLLSRPTEDWLSTQYRSAAYLPGVIDTRDFATWLATDPVPPPMPPVAKPRAWIRLHTSHRVRSGRRIAAGAFVKNTGKVSLVRAKLCLRPSARLARHPGCRFINLSPGRNRFVFVPVRTRPAVGGRLVIRASLWYQGRPIARDWARVGIVKR